MFNKQMFTQFLLDKSQSGQQYWCNVISIEIGIFHTIYIFKKMLWVELRTDPNVYQFLWHYIDWLVWIFNSI